MNRDVDEVALTMILFDKDEKRRKILLSYLESFCRSLYSEFYSDTKSSVTETSFGGDELDVTVKFKRD